MGRQIVDIFVVFLFVRGRFDVDGGGCGGVVGLFLNDDGVLLNKSGCQMVRMARGDTSYDPGSGRAH